MIEFGSTLRAAREAKGYTVAQLAELTRLAPRTVNELESEDFSHIAAPIYGRGFVKLYCEAVGLDAKPLVDEFMCIFNGEHDVAIRERSVADEPVAAPAEEVPAEADRAPEPLPQPDPSPSVIQQGGFFDDPEPVAAPEPVPVAAPEPDAETAEPEPFPAPEPSAGPSLSRYAAPVHTTRPAVPLSPTVWRLGVLAGAALVFLVLLICGIRALYRATSARPAETKPASSQSEAKPTPAAKPMPVKPASAAKPAPAPRQAQDIPSLYVD